MNEIDQIILELLKIQDSLTKGKKDSSEKKKREN
ncbi:hypothetical protein BJV85_002152 [Clostridium acetobutylicum]|nr:hypothetical protein [Clostridium acetobutylicum]NOW14801.1 hypothetical protein [Clostridium acetobutylicum]NRY56484.1 hypothetical protein [Clostridium acetobutylicum]NSA93229.1 hypothetical protein [Clostridium acetobutylicum]NYC94291.1 hypothetical protein [Clostridium acetobutylicum]